MIAAGVAFAGGRYLDNKKLSVPITMKKFITSSAE